MLNKIKANPDKQTFVVYIFLAAAVFVIFWQVTQCDFISFDDPVYVTENNRVQSGLTPEGLLWAFSTTYAEFWHPLTWISLMLDYQLYGLHAGGYHLTNLILHVLSALLLFGLLNRMTHAVWKSAFVAALFALHPLRVESVAWIAERKDVLSMFFGLAGIYFYVLYAESSKRSRYCVCFILFTLSLMSKPTLVTLPFILLLLDYWPLKRWQRKPEPAEAQVADTLPVKNKSEGIFVQVKRRSHSVSGLLWEKTPFLFLAMAAIVVTLWAQNKSRMIIPLEQLPLDVRIQNAVISYISYLGKIFWPVDLAFFYPLQNVFPLWQIFASCFMLCVGTAAVLFALRKMPFLFVGWFWYLGSLIPMIGFVKSTDYAMADRFTYFPSIGIAIGLVWSIGFLLSSEYVRKKILLPAGILVLIVLAILTWRQCGYWKNSVALSKHALRVTKGNYLSHVILGSSLAQEGRIQDAIDQYNEAIRLKPYYTYSYNVRGIAFSDTGRYERAIEDFNEAIRLRPDYADAYYNRGNAYSGLNQHRRALGDYNEVISLSPDYALAYLNRGNAYARLGQYLPAIENYNETIRLKPHNADAYYNRGMVYFMLGGRESGCRDALKACALGKCQLLEIAHGQAYCR